MARSDETMLTSALKSGNPELINQVFAAIYRQYAKLVAFNIAKYVSDQETIKDLTHDVFIKFFNAADRVEGELKSYLCAIARNTTLTYLRKQKGNRELVDCDQFPDPSQFQSALFYTELVEDLKKVLSDKEVAIILLKHEGYSFLEIGEKLAITANNANVIYFRALKKYQGARRES